MLTSFDSLEFKYTYLYWKGKGTRKIILGKNPVLAKGDQYDNKIFFYSSVTP